MVYQVAKGRRHTLPCSRQARRSQSLSTKGNLDIISESVGECEPRYNCIENPHAKRGTSSGWVGLVGDRGRTVRQNEGRLLVTGRQHGDVPIASMVRCPWSSPGSFPCIEFYEDTLSQLGNEPVERKAHPRGCDGFRPCGVLLFSLNTL